MKKITILGGDRRLRLAAKELEKNGYTVDTIGLYENDNGDISTSQFILLPVPTTKDKINIFAPLTNRKIPLSYVEENAPKDTLVLSCNFFFKNCACVDYGALDSYALLNAVPTAEGAIKYAIENTPFTIWKSKCLVIGYGRVGKVLANRLEGLGADVTVTARSPKDISLAEAIGFNSMLTAELNLKPLSYDIIFNTVDFEVINDEALKKLHCSLLLDLSSKGGFNLEKARDFGVNAIKLPGLPNITAPDTAAKILSDTVLHILNSYN
ncbi:MAG: hypothetical protein IKT38_08075 [Clostridia bacterium]|nr:hypothetical protein [Clostridia bacterium]